MFNCQRSYACGYCACWPVDLDSVSIGHGLLVVILFLYSFDNSIFRVHQATLAGRCPGASNSLYDADCGGTNRLTGITFSAWLSSFVFFLFLSLAFAKRAAELVKLSEGSQQSIPGRGYDVVDLQVITIAGICSGFLSSLVLALYINSEAVRLLYRRPTLLWGILPLLLYYIGRVWIICRRGQLHDDPIVYTTKTPSTYLLAAAVLVIVVAATIGFP